MSQTANGPGSRGKYDTTKRTTNKRPAAAQDDEPGCQDAARKSRSRDTEATNTSGGDGGVGRLAIPITFALLAVILGLALEIVARAVLWKAWRSKWLLKQCCGAAGRSK